MLILIAAASAAQVISLENRSSVTYDEGTPRFEIISWDQKPSPNDVQRALPKQSSDWLYAGLSCRTASATGKLKGCSITPIENSSRLAERAALKLVKSFTLPQAVINRRAHISEISVYLQFQYSMVEGARCGAPFCTPTPPPPSPPSAH